MTIGIDIRPLLSPVRTGVGQYAFGLLNALFAMDADNRYFLFYNDIGRMGRYAPEWEQENVYYVNISVPSKVLNSAMLIAQRPRIDRMIQRRNSQFSILNSQLDYFFSPNPNFLALSPGVRHIITIHDLSFELFPRCYTWKRRLWHAAVNPRRQCARAYRILTPSAHTARDVVREYDVLPEKVRAILPGVPSEGTPAGKRPLGTPDEFFLFLGAIEPRKNVSGLLEAYRRYAADAAAPLPFVLAGPAGWKCRSELSMMRQTRGVIYLEAVTEEEKKTLYRLARALVFPSIYEGFGFPVLEAMREGTAVIAGNRSSIPEVAGNAAILVDPHDARDIARAMGRVAEDARLSKTLGELGRARAAEFTWERAAREFLSVLSD